MAIREILEGGYRIICRIRSQQVDVLTVRCGARCRATAKRCATASPWLELPAAELAALIAVRGPYHPILDPLGL